MVFILSTYSFRQETILTASDIITVINLLFINVCFSGPERSRRVVTLSVERLALSGAEGSKRGLTKRLNETTLFYKYAPYLLPFSAKEQSISFYISAGSNA